MHHRVHALNASSNFTIGDAFDLKRMKVTELGDLLKA
jgi:hypothetical protein